MDTLNLVAQIAAIIGAVTLIAVAPLEMFLYDRPFARRFLHADTTNIEDVRMWAFCIGARNLIIGVTAIVGLVMMWTGDGPVGVIVVLTASWYMLLSALAMGAADVLGYWKPHRGSVTGVFGSGIPPLVVLVASLF